MDIRPPETAEEHKRRVRRDKKRRQKARKKERKFQEQKWLQDQAAARKQKLKEKMSMLKGRRDKTVQSQLNHLRKNLKLNKTGQVDLDALMVHLGLEDLSARKQIQEILGTPGNVDTLLQRILRVSERTRESKEHKQGRKA
jgi:hypothetical protein